jgi:GntR family transcriptional regulator, transcriptional repressor for pyruvate dehydrogenase complex
MNVDGNPNSGNLKRPDKVSEVLARQIVQDLAREKQPPGAMLDSEGVMQARYGVGRNSLREALRILEVYGLIRLRQGAGGGPSVGVVSSADFGRTSTFYYHQAGSTVRELLEARRLMEPVMAGLAASRGDDELAAQLDAVLEDEASGTANYHLSDVRQHFHAVISRASGNGILGLYSASLLDIYAERVKRLTFLPEEQARITAEHRQIALAVKSHDSAKAQKLMQRHMDDFHKQTIERFPDLMDEIVDWR